MGHQLRRKKPKKRTPQEINESLQAAKERIGLKAQVRGGDLQQGARVVKFAERWKNKGSEKADCQKFWLDLLASVCNVENPAEHIVFEDTVKGQHKGKHKNFIDARIPSTHVLIEQKSWNKKLRIAASQSDGSFLTPFEQAKRYDDQLAYSEKSRWIVTCNFSEFQIYDMNNPGSEPELILLKDLPNEYHRLNFLVDAGDENVQHKVNVSLKAGELVGRLYDAFLKQYRDPQKPETLHSLNVLCVRLVFCLYAADAGIFGSRTMFHDYMKQFDAKSARDALIKLFHVLDQTEEQRDPYMDEKLAAFPYVNGGLFRDTKIEIPNLNDEILQLLLNNASRDFDWSRISPTIFGAVFESTLNPETRRCGGMHYTAIENIHKVIDPLFLDDLRVELDSIRNKKQVNVRVKNLYAFQQKLASLKFLDPACGSGNFLTETYIALRHLENEVISELFDVQTFISEDVRNPIKVSIDQFYGIEINDFAVAVAKTALWIAESQMMRATEEIIHFELNFLPLKSYANIIEGNALQLDWETVVPKEELSYIMGNPPFVGARMMSAEQKNDVLGIFDGVKNSGNLDYVSCWYKKAADLMSGTQSRAALVSTNSITQGEQVAILWKELFKQGLHIDFAHRTFRWDSEASQKAHVHCVIVGFSFAPTSKEKLLFDEGIPKTVENINGYLVEAENVFIESRIHPLCGVPEIGIGNKPIDGGNYLFTYEEMQDFIKKEPVSAQYFKPWLGSKEFINGFCRYCLWVGDCTPAQLRSMPEVMKRVTAVREFRLKSSSAGTRQIAEKPTRFHVENMPKSNYILIPKVSSERRKYVPMGFLTPEILCSDLVFIIPNATLYHFGVLTSNVHMAWTRAVCGRLKSDYRYSKDIVYNNFPWPEASEEQKAKIERTAQGILDARRLYPDSSLADLYDESAMPPELRRAHQENDRAVLKAYGFSSKITESECVARLMERYKDLTS